MKKSKQMNKISLIILIMFFSEFAQTQDTIPLLDLVVKKYEIEYEIDEVIRDGDYTYLTPEYSADSSLFYYNNQLFNGVGLINDSIQYTLINFENGQLNGLWHDVMFYNNGLTHKGEYKNGLEEGEWIAGYGSDTVEFEIYLSEIYSKGILEGKQKYYGSSFGVFQNDGYEGVEFKKGEKISAPVFYNLDDSFKNGTEIKEDIYDYRFENLITESTTFVDGILIKQEKFVNDTLFQLNEFSVYNLSYNIFQINYHSNGKIESRGDLFDYIRKSGDWLYYDSEGNLIKEEYWEFPFGWDMSYKTKTISYKKDGSIDEVINH